MIETKAEAETRALQKCAPADTEFTKVDYTVTQKIRDAENGKAINPSNLLITQDEMNWSAAKAKTGKGEECNWNDRQVSVKCPQDCIQIETRDNAETRILNTCEDPDLDSDQISDTKTDNIRTREMANKGKENNKKGEVCHQDELSVTVNCPKNCKIIETTSSVKQEHTKNVLILIMIMLM